jgi:hypothetical protein
MTSDMVLLLAFLTASYFTVVIWVRRATRRQAAPVADAVAARLPAEDRPPASAVGWPPKGERFTSYVDEGFAALDAYLQDGYAT